MLHDEKGADFLTVKLIVVLIITSLLIAIAATFAGQRSSAIASGSARNEMIKVAKLASAEYADSCLASGDGATITVSLPGSIRRVIFGGALANGSVQRVENAYSIEYNDGSTEIFLADMPFARGCAAGAVDEPVVLYPGKYELHIKTELMNDSIVVAITAEALC